MKTQFHLVGKIVGALLSVSLAVNPTISHALFAQNSMGSIQNKSSQNCLHEALAATVISPFWGTTSTPPIRWQWVHRLTEIKQMTQTWSFEQQIDWVLGICVFAAAASVFFNSYGSAVFVVLAGMYSNFRGKTGQKLFDVLEQMPNKDLLGPQQKKAIQLALSGLSLSAVAAQMNLSTPAVRMNLKRALVNLWKAGLIDPKALQVTKKSAFEKKTWKLTESDKEKERNDKIAEFRHHAMDARVNPIAIHVLCEYILPKMLGEGLRHQHVKQEYVQELLEMVLGAVIKPENNAEPFLAGRLVVDGSSDPNYGIVLAGDKTVLFPFGVVPLDKDHMSPLTYAQFQEVSSYHDQDVILFSEDVSDMLTNAGFITRSHRVYRLQNNPVILVQVENVTAQESKAIDNFASMRKLPVQIVEEIPQVYKDKLIAVEVPALSSIPTLQNNTFDDKTIVHYFILGLERLLKQITILLPRLSNNDPNTIEYAKKLSVNVARTLKEKAVPLIIVHTVEDMANMVTNSLGFFTVPLPEKILTQMIQTWEKEAQNIRDLLPWLEANKEIIKLPTIDTYQHPIIDHRKLMGMVREAA